MSRNHFVFAVANGVTFLPDTLLRGNVAAAIFLSKNVLGYKDIVENEPSGPDKKGITIVVRSVLQPPEEIDC